MEETILNPQQVKPKYSDYDWPVDNTGWFVGKTSMNGRWRRREFGVVALACSLLLFVPVISYAAIIVMVAAAAKRLHDMDITSKWIFLYLALSIGVLIMNTANPTASFILQGLQIVIQLFLLFWPPTHGINKYGSDPRQDYEEQCIEAGYPRLSDCF